jgi:hypothetical protein
MQYEKAFFDLQVQFAQRAASLAGVPLEQALLDCTNLYVRFGAGRAFDARHPLWVAYGEGLRETQDVAGWTWRYLQQCPVQLGAPAVLAACGCFSYAREGDDAVRLHFSAQAMDGAPPLGEAQRAVRQQELRSLFTQLPTHMREPDPLVQGTSWLYNLPAYRRLFPAAYLATATPAPRLRALSLWGQFLDRHGRLRAIHAAEFSQRVAHHRDYATLVTCFPLQALALSAPASVFYAHFRVSSVTA